MRFFIPLRPSGSDRFALFVQAVWDILWGKESLFIDTPNGPIKFEKQTNGQYLPILSKQFGGGTGGWFFWDPLVYDSKIGYSQNGVVFVGEENPAVTDGPTSPDIAGAEAAKATPGLWVCFKSPRVTVAAVTTVHLPTWRNPLESDVEDVYWIPIWTNICG